MAQWVPPLSLTLLNVCVLSLSWSEAYLSVPREADRVCAQEKVLLANHVLIVYVALLVFSSSSSPKQPALCSWLVPWWNLSLLWLIPNYFLLSWTHFFYSPRWQVQGTRLCCCWGGTWFSATVIFLGFDFEVEIFKGVFGTWASF